MYKLITSTLLLLCTTYTNAYFQTDGLNSTTISANGSYTSGTVNLGGISATSTNNSAYTGSTLPYSESDPTCNPPPVCYIH